MREHMEKIHRQEEQRRQLQQQIEQQRMIAAQMGDEDAAKTPTGPPGWYILYILRPLLFKLLVISCCEGHIV